MTADPPAVEPAPDRATGPVPAGLGPAGDPVGGPIPDPVGGPIPDPVGGPIPDPVGGPIPDPVGGRIPDPVGGPIPHPAGPGGAGTLPAPLAPVSPRYGGASLADLLPSALAVLGVPGARDPLQLRPSLAGVDRLAVLLVDGLGQYLLPLAVPHAPTLADLLAGGRVLTCGFPSTTPTSLVSLGTGAAPGAHGVLGFRLNVPGTDRVLNHIDWSEDPDPVAWQPVPTQLEIAAAAGVATVLVGDPALAATGLTRAANRGGQYRGAAGVEELAGRILGALAGEPAPVLVSAYLPDVDKAGHLAGVDSAWWREAVVGLDRLLTRLVAGLPAGAALLVTADHGQLNIPAEHRFDLDEDDRLRHGVRVVAGEPRVRYLHTVAGARADVIATWRGVLGPAAWVVERDEAVAAGWFGPVPEGHRDRIGDVVVACHDTYAVVASRTGNPIESRLIAYHGSYTAAEMFIPLLVARSG